MIQLYNYTHMQYFIANWKAHHDIKSTAQWMNEFILYLNQDHDLTNLISQKQTTVIICPPLPLLSIMKEFFLKIPFIDLGVQDISIQSEGSFTGDVPITSLKDLAHYAILNHSERKKIHGETNIDALQKFTFAQNNGIKTIYCVSENESFPQETDFLCFEPPEAISNGDGKGTFIDPKKVKAVRSTFILHPQTKFLYGGSVNEEDITLYAQIPEIDGVLVGGASLNPKRFISIIKQGIL